MKHALYKKIYLSFLMYGCTLSSPEATSNSLLPPASEKIATFSLIQFSRENTYQKVDVRYPHIADNAAELNHTIEETLHRMIETHAQECKRQYTLYNTNGMPEECRPSFPFCFSATPHITHIDDNDISLHIACTVYGGGAHSSCTRISFNYDIKQQKLVTLQDLLPTQKSMLTLAKLCKKKLVQEHAIAEPYKEGLDPEYSNFSVFTFTPETITIHFEEYQVCCYAEGTPSVTISRTDIEGMRT